MSERMKKPLRAIFGRTHATAKNESLPEARFVPESYLITPHIPSVFWERLIQSELSQKLDELERGAK